jgi:hypothetical protein
MAPAIFGTPLGDRLVTIFEDGARSCELKAMCHICLVGADENQSLGGQRREKRIEFLIAGVFVDIE